MFLNPLVRSLFGRYVGINAFYLPATRTGVMQSHQVIASASVQLAAYAGLAQFERSPHLSGILADFLRVLIEIDVRYVKSVHVHEIAENMERDILHGSIRVDYSGARYPRFMYKTNGLDIPLSQASSMVSEVAPVVLFTKHRVGKGDLLIIEEPEAHLHPAAQIEMAKAIARFVRAGVKVLVTTHSENFLDALANCVRQSIVGSKNSDSSLGKDMVGLYGFEKSKSGTTVKNLGFDKESGLSPDDHDSVNSDLYNDTVNLLQRMDDMETRND